MTPNSVVPSLPLYDREPQLLITTADRQGPCLVFPTSPRPHAPTTTTSFGTGATPGRSPGHHAAAAPTPDRGTRPTRSAIPTPLPRTRAATAGRASRSESAPGASVGTSSRSRIAIDRSDAPSRTTGDSGPRTRTPSVAGHAAATARGSSGI